MAVGTGSEADEPRRNSPASLVCYLGHMERMERMERMETGASRQRALSNTMSKGNGTQEVEGAERSALSLQVDDESDSTPRSEVPSVVDSTVVWDQHTSAQPTQTVPSEPGYFSPQPLRFYPTRLPTSTTASTEPSPTQSLNASTTSIYVPQHASLEHPINPSTPLEQQDRPAIQTNISSASTASASTVRPASTDPIRQFTTPPKPHRDGPHYPNQSYAALQAQPYPPPYSPQILRTRSSHPSHYSSFSTTQIATFGLAIDQDRSMADSGSRTVGNSPASSPGLFSPTTPPLRHGQQSSEDHGFYSSPYLHYTHRQAPKETHIADVDVDPISGRKIINQYEVIDELGRGVHGKVKLGRSLTTNDFVAIKIVDRYSKRRRLGKNTSHEDKIKREIAILKKARHPNIVSLLEVIDDPTRKKVYIVLEHVELGEVKWRIEGAKEIALIEWRRYHRESDGIFHNDAAAIEDEMILESAQRRRERRERRRLRELHGRQLRGSGMEPWSFEHGGDSDSDSDSNASNNDRSSRVSNTHADELPANHYAFEDQDDSGHSNDEEGTMYGPYDPDMTRGRTPSVAGSSSSHFTDLDDTSGIPEHFRYVPLMTLDSARDAFRDTVLGLEYLHYQGVIHRDIKPANLLQTKEHRIKISDFGVSYLGRQASEDSAEDQSESEQDADEAIELAKTVGTPAFYAPELCRTDIDAETPPVTAKIDVWALGVTLYCLVFGRVPFHDNNTFVLMRLITDRDVYIPRIRLKAVAEKSGSRPTSHGRMYHLISSNKRAPLDLEYEVVDDDLYDLLRRLLIKDPRKRITLKEIKRHPWLLQGIDNKVAWVEETDPTRQTQGRKIEVSKDEVEQAVVPISIIERVRSGLRKTVGAVLNIGTRGGSRRRAQSSATATDTAHLSANSSSSTISHDGRRDARRPSLAVNESIFAALKNSREGEHPLSQSVTASPEPKEKGQFFEGTDSRSHSPSHSAEGSEHPAPLMGSSRPPPPERAQSTISTMSTATSIRTIRQSDIIRTARTTSPTLPPGLPGTPLALDTPGGSNLGGIFGGVPRRLMNSVRSRERVNGSRNEHNRAKSIDRLVTGDDDPHGGPSIALSNAFAAGHVDQPAILKEPLPHYNFPASPANVLSEHLYPDPLDRASSRQSSISSASSRLNHIYTIQDDRSMTQSPGGYPFPSLQRETSDDRFNRAKDELVRRRVLEENQIRERPHSAVYPRPLSSLSQTACPPSPDDETFYHRQRLDDFFNQQQRSHNSSIENSPISYPVSVNSLQYRTLTSSSSEDHFTSMSQSTSNPSIPSVISANSSVAPDDGFLMEPVKEVVARASDDTLNPNAASSEDYTGYEGDIFGSSEDNDEQEESDDDFIVMTRKKKGKEGLERSDTISNAELSRHRVRRELASSCSRKSTRSGSNGTVKKVRPHEDTDDEGLHGVRSSESI
ncbi:kinase-like protein [Glonium stellatum]|uniref:non-specific serine/threonine protein kinase n=1 Tax=Glonium stellatum TaxID=574774 RepID=A0A8E2ER27_9PEZI|nr:kinase-like protein [Glonium stellatum]